MHELLPNVLAWTWFSEPHGYNFNGTLVLSQSGNLCIDPVPPNGVVLDRLQREGVAQIVITNRNHTRAANRVAERTGAKVVIHPADAPHARKQKARIDGDLEVGQQVGSFTVVGVPGKSPGEVALHDPGRGILVVGDVVIGNPRGALSLLPDYVMDDAAQLKVSIRSLMDLDFDTLIVGDGESILKGAKERLGELVATLDA